MVDKVQLYDKKSDQAAFTGIDDGVKTKTINIKLKEDKKNGEFGKVDGNVGTDGYYEGQLQFNKFKAKEKFALYGTAANDGKTGLGFQDSNNLGVNNSNVQFMDGGGISITMSGSNDAVIMMVKAFRLHHRPGYITIPVGTMIRNRSIPTIKLGQLHLQVLQQPILSKLCRRVLLIIAVMKILMITLFAKSSILPTR